ncbi:hypothetical protein MPSEU_000375500 [Mayamaea pseudoterrestris]|nr:hypothetical protein MPSEU_000375500 [Mayamaea pseudoterrestris]
MASRNPELLSKEDWSNGPHNYRGTRIPPGTLVSFHGLKSLSYLNGTMGHVYDYHSAKGRYEVCDFDKARHLVKFENIKQHPEVKMEGLQSRKDLNGKKGLALDIDKAKDRWSIQVGQEVVSLKRDNVIFLHGTFCRIVGLKNKTELNGAHATIRWKVDAEETLQKDQLRYDLHLANGETVRVKQENIQL